MTQSWTSSQPPAMQQALNVKSYIANILPFSYTIARTYGVFFIPACPEGEDFALAEIDSRNAPEDVGDSKRRGNPIFAADIAADLVRHINGDAGEGSFLGVFICGQNGPTKAALQSANDRVNVYCRQMVRNADTEHQRNPRTVDITDFQRWAVKRLNIEGRDWDGSFDDMVRCPGCQASLRKGAVICTVCQTILDEEKYAKLKRAPAGALPPRERTSKPGGSSPDDADKPGGGKAISA